MQLRQPLQKVVATHQHALRKIGITDVDKAFYSTRHTMKREAAIVISTGKPLISLPVTRSFLRWVRSRETFRTKAAASARSGWLAENDERRIALLAFIRRDAYQGHRQFAYRV